MSEEEKRCKFCKQIYKDWEDHWMRECPYGDGEQWAEPEECKYKGTYIADMSDKQVWNYCRHPNWPKDKSIYFKGECPDCKLI